MPSGILRGQAPDQPGSAWAGRLHSLRQAERGDAGAAVEFADQQRVLQHNRDAVDGRGAGVAVSVCL
jgi:hypothetical protein